MVLYFMSFHMFAAWDQWGGRGGLWGKVWVVGEVWVKKCYGAL